MTRFPLIVFFFLFFPCLLGIGVAVYCASLPAVWLSVWYALLGYLCLTTAVAVWGLVWFIRQWWRPYRRFARASEAVAIGNKVRNRRRRTGKYWKPLQNTLIELEKQFDELIDFSTSLAQQNFDTELSERLQNTPFAKRLIDVQEKLQQKQTEANIQSWTMRGLAEFSDVLRNSEHLELETLATFFLRKLVKYMNAQQGVVYLLNLFDGEEQDDLYLRLMAHYAISKTDFENKRVEIEEGLTGECFRKRKYYYIQDVQDNYSPIFSGLGAGSPRSLLIFPITLNDKTLGVLEMASWNVYEQYHLDFLETICENLAVAIEGFYMQTQTKRLLKETEKANKELRAQEKEMKHNAKELELTQAELNQKLLIIEEETTFLKYILQAIDKTNAMLEFDMEGTILEANDMYMSVMGYTEQDIVDKNEIILLPPDEINSERYNMMWETLRAGNFISGEYRRMAQDGREVWLNGTYNPIYDIEGKPVRVMMLAQFTTEDKERDLKQVNKINALSQALMIIEAHTSGAIKTANSNFIQHFGLKRSDLRNLPVANLLQIRTENIATFDTLWRKAMQGETCPPEMLAYQTAGKRLVYANTYFCPIKNLVGEIESIVIVLMDTTELEESREKLNVYANALQENNQHLEKLFLEENQLATILWQTNKAFELDASHKITRMNDLLAKKINFDTNNNTLAPFEDLVQKTFPQNVLQEMWNTVQEKGFAEVLLKYQIAKNAYFWGKTVVKAYQDIHTKTVRYMGVIQDVTEQVVKEVYLRGELVELKLKSAMLQYAHLFDGEENPTWQKLPQFLRKLDGTQFDDVVSKDIVPYLRVGKNGEILQTNQLALDVLGYKRDELLAINWQELLVFKNDEQQIAFRTKLDHNQNGLEQWLIMNNYQGNGIYTNALIKTQNEIHNVFFVVP